MERKEFYVSPHRTARASAFVRKMVLVASLVGCGDRTALEIPEARDAGAVDAGGDSGTGTSFSCVRDPGPDAGFNVNARFQAGVPPIQFNTDMRFTSSFSASLASGAVMSGNPGDLRDGDSVCAGSVVKLTPSLDARWFVSSLDVVSLYPVCAADGYCPQMVEYSACTGNRPAAWLGRTLYEDNKSFGLANDFTSSQERHAGLGASSFFPEPVTYLAETNGYSHFKKGGAAVFCQGNIEFLQDHAVAASEALPSQAPSELVLGALGTHALSTRISGADCFAAVVKYPIDLPDHPEFFQVYYFAHNAPALPQSFGERSLNLNVVDCH